MKPTRNRIFCPDCGRVKMLFETDKKANTFIAFNREEILATSGFAPTRSYYCTFCGGWHVTHIPERSGPSKKELWLDEYLQTKGSFISGKLSPSWEEKRESMIRALEDQIKNIRKGEQEAFFLEKITRLKKEIDEWVQARGRKENETLKDLRVHLEVVYIVKKRQGIGALTQKIHRTQEKDYEDWKAWMKKIGYQNP